MAPQSKNSAEIYLSKRAALPALRCQHNIAAWETPLCILMNIDDIKGGLPSMLEDNSGIAHDTPS